MRVLLDECLPRKLAGMTTGHEVSTVAQAGRAGKSNGELLRAAEAEYDAFLTIDQNMESQQNIGGIDLAVVVLRSPSSRLADLTGLVPSTIDALDRAQPATCITSDHSSRSFAR